MTNNPMDTDIELVVRALVALGDETGYRAIDLVLDLDMDCGDADIMARTRKIIEDGFGRPITDSTIDDLTEFIDDGTAGDMANE
jgi:hypothetical protein